MSQYMPYGGFNWVEPTLNVLNDLDNTSPIGRIYEVDVSYPKELHDQHNYHIFYIFLIITGT